MGEKKLDKYSIEEYLKYEENSEIKNEYENGYIYSMSGGTINHGLIGSRFNGILLNEISKKNLNCIPFSSDVKVFIDDAESFVYPDGMVICGDIETSEYDKNSVTNPMLIIEVLSNSTEKYDRGDKFHKYSTLKSFKEYILISQDKYLIDQFFRKSENQWEMQTIIGDESILKIKSLNIEIKLSDIYQKVKFEN
jgi:Uma2 family endonuclease